jgi:hypothetical protein
MRSDWLNGGGRSDVGLLSSFIRRRPGRNRARYAMLLDCNVERRCKLVDLCCQTDR